MLVLTRKVGERLFIGKDIILTVVRIQGDKVRLGIDAPQHLNIAREEIASYDHAQRSPSRQTKPDA